MIMFNNWFAEVYNIYQSPVASQYEQLNFSCVA